MPANATDPILTVKMKHFLSFHHGSKIVGHNAAIPSHTTLFALTQAGSLRSCIGGGFRIRMEDCNHFPSCCVWQYILNFKVNARKPQWT